MLDFANQTKKTQVHDLSKSSSNCGNKGDGKNDGDKDDDKKSDATTLGVSKTRLVGGRRYGGVGVVIRPILGTDLNIAGPKLFHKNKHDSTLHVCTRIKSIFHWVASNILVQITVEVTPRSSYCR